MKANNKNNKPQDKNKKEYQKPKLHKIKLPHDVGKTDIICGMVCTSCGGSCVA